MKPLHWLKLLHLDFHGKFSFRGNYAFDVMGQMDKQEKYLLFPTLP